MSSCREREKTWEKEGSTILFYGGHGSTVVWPVSPTQRRRDLFSLEGERFWLTSFAQIELGTACGKLFRCSTMAVLDAGDSDILSEQAS